MIPTWNHSTLKKRHIHGEWVSYSSIFVLKYAFIHFLCSFLQAFPSSWLEVPLLLSDLFFFRSCIVFFAYPFRSTKATNEPSSVENRSASSLFTLWFLNHLSFKTWDDLQLSFCLSVCVDSLNEETKQSAMTSDSRLFDFEVLSSEYRMRSFFLFLHFVFPVFATFDSNNGVHQSVQRKRSLFTWFSWCCFWGCQWCRLCYRWHHYFRGDRRTRSSSIVSVIVSLSWTLFYHDMQGCLETVLLLLVDVVVTSRLFGRRSLRCTFCRLLSKSFDLAWCLALFDLWEDIDFWDEEEQHHPFQPVLQDFFKARLMFFSFLAFRSFCFNRMWRSNKIRFEEWDDGRKSVSVSHCRQDLKIQCRHVFRDSLRSYRSSCSCFLFEKKSCCCRQNSFFLWKEVHQERVGHYS